MKISELRQLIREEISKVLNESVARIKGTDLIKKLAPLKTMGLNVSSNDIRSLTFVSNKAGIMKIWKALGTLGVQDYFDYPLDDSEFSGKGTWVINAQEALDNGLITK